MKAMSIRRHGGPEVLEWVDIDLPPPGPHEVRVRHTAIGLNFSDINLRNGGFYSGEAAKFPIILGNEAAAVVEEVGSAVRDFAPGERVAYVGMGRNFFEDTGAYAELRNVPARQLIRLPPDVSDAQAAGMLLKGLTAAVIIHRCFRPASGNIVLVHAAASGVGSLLAQWSTHLGATVIGTAGSGRKAEHARAHGCRHTILYREEDFVEAAKRIAPGGVCAVFDGVGKDTFLRSLDCIKPFGTMVNYGNASGPVPPFNILLLGLKGCIALHRPGFSWYANTPQARTAACNELFDLVRRGVLRIDTSVTFPLARAADAHREVEAGRTSGSVILLP
jgi:NADPH2:quinone reductase